MAERFWAWSVLLSVSAGVAWLVHAQGLPAPASHVTPVAPIPEPIDFDRDVRPILEAHCWKCHGTQKHRGGLRLDSRDAVIKGGESGPAAISGRSGESLLIELVSGVDPDRIMPDEGPRLTQPQIDTLAAWIDQGLVWGTEVVVPAAPRYELALKQITVPPASAGSQSSNPIDLIIGSLAQETDASSLPVSDRLYARRVFYDVIGLPPTPSELETFLGNPAPDKRENLVQRLLADNRRYAEHWLTFWNDCLRNDYAGTGYIDGGREQITQWLFEALYNNMPYDRFVSELVNPPSNASAGFSKGIIWRGVVNASQIPPMQAAQNISQVFLGLNLKCASCHDSFINNWKLSDAYGMAAVFAEEPLEVNRCDRPIGTLAKAGFLYHELGEIQPDAPRADRLRQLSALLIARENGRFTRTIVNRLWARLMGRGIVEPVDEMDNPPWNADLLDFLAADLFDRGYDLKKTLELILTSRAYQMAATPSAEKFESAAPFAGPVVRRLGAEEFVDAVRSLAGIWPDKSDARIKVPGVDGPYPGPIRAGLQVADPLMLALGRPNREQVVTSRPGVATTLQAIELTNGGVLDSILRQGARRWLSEYPAEPRSLVIAIYTRALGRPPTDSELRDAVDLLGPTPGTASVQDLLWAITMLPEFQLIS